MSPFLFGLALVLGAPALKEKESPPSPVGEWVIEQRTVGGEPAPSGKSRWVFRADGSQAMFGAANGKELVSGNYTIDPRAGTLDYDWTGEPGGEHRLCRFKVDGDTLTLNVAWQKATRPASLESGSRCTLYVMTWVKPKD
jgi:hypothetical protein